MSYHVVPELSPDEVKKVKTIAIRLDIKAKELVRRAIVSYIKQLEED